MHSLIERFGASVAVAFGMGLLLALIILPVTTNAQSIRDAVPQSAQTARELAQERKVNAQEAANEKREAVLQKRDEKKLAAQLQACQNRETRVTNLMARIADRGQQHLDVFTKISDRTKAFYETKGYDVANYDELIARVDDAREAAKTQADIQSELSVGFNCDLEDPKASTTAFKAQLTDQIAALKDYRTAVKNLIVAVKSAESTADTTEVTTEAEVETETGTTEETNE